MGANPRCFITLGRLIKYSHSMRPFLSALLEYKNLLYVFVLRDIVARYKQTAIGVGWAVIQPLFLMVIFSLIFGRFLGVSSGDVPYPIFSYVGILPWTFFSRSLLTASESLLNFGNLISKVYFPREIAPLSYVISSLVDFGIGLLVFLLLLIFYKVPLTLTFFYLLILIPIQIFLASGLAILLSGITVMVQDLKFALPLLIQILLYASPVIYSITNIQSQFKILFYLNPFVGIIESYRQVIIFNRPPVWDYLSISVLFGFLFTVGGWWLFKKLEPYFVDIL